MYTRMHAFRYERPGNLEETIELLARLQGNGEEFVLSAGGTDLVPGLKLHDTWVGSLISLTGLRELHGVHLDGERVRIGALTTLAELALDAGVRRELPGLAAAAAEIASPQIRNRATVGGNLLVDHRCMYYNQSVQNRCAHDSCFKAGGEGCHLIPNAVRGKLPLCRARFVSDLAPVLLCLDARVRLVGPKGWREVLLAGFYLPDGMDRNVLRDGEILAEVEVRLPAPAHLRYEKLRIRNAIDFASLGVAVALLSKGKTWELRVSLTGVNEAPYHGRWDEKECGGRDAMILRACEEASKTVVPLKQDFFPPSYRRKMVSVLIRRALGRFEGWK